MFFLPNSTTAVGLQYRAIAIPDLTKPIWVLRDEFGDDWVDIRSIIESLGLAWPRWNLLLRARRGTWKLDPCMDRQGRQTELLPATAMMRFLGDIKPLTAYHRAAHMKMPSLRAGWRTAYLGEEAEASPTTKPNFPKKGGRPSNISAETVINLYRAKQSGRSTTDAAKLVGISRSAAYAICGGTCNDWDDSAAMAWSETFGSDNPSKNSQNRPHRVTKSADAPG